ncbi:MAG: carboxylating nicotinate-nucleotide diphosphorylase [Rubrobacter sp.]
MTGATDVPAATTTSVKDASRVATTLDTRELRSFIEVALREDIGRGDVTSELTVTPGARASGFFLAKSELTVFGLEIARLIFETHLAGDDLAFETLVSEGESVAAGIVIAKIEGPARGLLGAERVALNLLMRLSGVATLTARYAEAVAGTGARVCDTRKTTPGLRALEKAAVRAGGGVNHRFGLDDGILIKDNHIEVAGGVGRAVELAKAGAPHLLKVEVEVEDEAGLEEAIEAGADAILLDNMTPAEVARCVGIVRRRSRGVVIEVSGNIGLHNVFEHAQAGPDLISVGALTHSAVAADISLKLTASGRG